MSEVFREGSSGEPKFSKSFTVLKKSVLQVTDIVTNKNKYYAIELHSDDSKYRVFTHYGRTDDLDKNPDSGIKECRYFKNQIEAENTYNKIYNEKTSPRKGYKEVNLASSKIGSSKSRGTSSGEMDDKTLKKLAENNSATQVIVPTLSSNIRDIVSYLYSEAKNALTSTVNASITANGIETPLGVLTIGQIDKGQLVLDDIKNLLNKKQTQSVLKDLTDLSGQFYTHIPHRFGRTRDSALEAIIDSADKFNTRQETLQLMRDMLNVNSKSNVLFDDKVKDQYDALNCKIDYLSPTEDKYKEILELLNSSRKTRRFVVKNIFSLYREKENKEFKSDIGNINNLFHGSSAKNWLGIVSRGLLLPKTVVSMGVKRTDAGWLGHGIYFGDVLSTSMQYASPGKRGTSLIAIASVALGKVKKYSKITYGLTSPPDGFNSAHGVKGTEFYDDEFVVYDHAQQKLDYLIEIKNGDY